MISLTYEPTSRLECSNCTSTLFIDDFARDDRVCRCCGMVVERRIGCHLTLDESRAVRSAGRESGAYKRIYHLNERIKQMHGAGPPTDDDVIELVHEAFLEYCQDDVDVDRLTARWIKGVCVHHGFKQLAERWIEIRHRVAGLCGLVADLPHLTGSEEQEFARRFARASTAFDTLFYRRGNRATRRDHSIPTSKHRLARHNMLNYNYVFHQLFAQLGVRRRIRAHFFFGLPTTARVLANLHQRWSEICRHVGDGWECYSTSDILDPDYAHDPEPMFAAKRTVYASIADLNAAFEARKKR